MSLMMKMTFDPSRPLIARSMARAVIGSLNFSISNLIQQHLKAIKYGTPVAEGAGIDAANEEIADAAAATETSRVRGEQGFSTAVPPLELAARLKTIRDALADDLLQHAGRKAMVTDPSRTLPDQFHIGSPFSESLDFQTKLAPRVNEAQIRAEAKALNVAEDDIRSALVSRHQRNLNFLKENRAEIEKIYGELPPTDDGDAELAFDALPAMVKMRLAAKADAGLYNARQREIERHLSGADQNAAGNVSMIDGTRREVLAEIQRWMQNSVFRAEIDEAVSKGSNMPQFVPAPHEQKPDEVEDVRQKRAA